VTTFLNPRFKSPAIPPDMPRTRVGSIFPGTNLELKALISQGEAAPSQPAAGFSVVGQLVLKQLRDSQPPHHPTLPCPWRGREDEGELAGRTIGIQ